MTEEAWMQTQEVKARAWREGQLGAATIRANNWRLAATGTILALLVSLAMNLIMVLHYRASPPSTPDVWVIDPQSTVLWHGPPGSYEIKDLWVGSRIKAWVLAVRGRPDDLVVMGDDHRMARQMTTGDAVAFLETYFKEHDPRLPDLAANPIRVRIPPDGPGSLQLKRRSAKLYDVEWIETWTPTYGKRQQRVKVSATMTVDWRPPSKRNGILTMTSKAMNESELAVYVTSCAWTEIILDGGL